MKINKIFYGVMVILLLIIFGYHYKLNYNNELLPPSEKWAKEVQIAEGDIKGFSSITKYKENYLVAFNEGENIKILSIDSVGRILNQGTISLKGEIPHEMHIFVNRDIIYVTYLLSGKEGENLKVTTLEESLNIRENKEINEIKDYVIVNNNTLGVLYKEKIDLINLEENKITTVKTGDDNFQATVVKYENKDCIIFSNTLGDLNYFYFENGVASEIKLGGALSQYSKVRFRDLISIVDKDVVTNLIEYIFKSDYIGYKYITFSLKTGEVIGTGEFPIKYEFADKGYIYNGSGISIGTPAPYKEQPGTMLISTSRDVAKGKSQTDIVEMKIEDKLGVMMDPVSRTKAVSINPSVYEDTLVFLDPLKEGYGKLYITSTRADFKEYNNKSRVDEKISALIQDFEGLLFTLAYVVTYGMIWIIPALSMFSLLSLLEYKYSYKRRKLTFIIAYIISTIIKIFVVKSLSFTRFRALIPAHFTFGIGVLAMSIISIVCLLYGYINYKEDLEKNVMALSFSKPIFIDSFLTLALFVGFLK